MKLSKKTFLYSILLAVIMVSLVVGYFVWMLPSLYVDYVKKSNLESVVAIQEGYMKTKSYENLTVKNPSGTLTVEIPATGDVLYATGKFFNLSIHIKDEELKGFLEQFRNFSQNSEAWQDSEVWQETEKDISDSEVSEYMKEFKEKILSKEFLSKESPVEVKLETKRDDTIYQEANEKVHMISDSLIVFETSISDGNNAYSTYLAMSKGEDSTIITILTAMSPEMNEILPVVFQSLPMIVAVIFCLVLIASQAFSKNIVAPIISLASYSESAKEAEHFQVEPFFTESKDEIGDLGRTLNELYEKLRDSYLELEEKNHILEEENERQEVFLRASSHQLKTPITAALLLVEGMINEVGKYKNTKDYLPKVKEQLLSMRKIVEDILYLNHCADHLQIEKISLKEITEELVNAYWVQITEKGLLVEIEGSGMVEADREIFKKMLDNLLSNAVAYTPEGEKIHILLQENQVSIKNEGAFIEEALLPNIYEPFVSSDTNKKGKGLGLYVVSYYSRLTGGKVTVENVEGGVLSKLVFQSGTTL